MTARIFGVTIATSLAVELKLAEADVPASVAPTKGKASAADKKGPPAAASAEEKEADRKRSVEQLMANERKLASEFCIDLSRVRSETVYQRRGLNYYASCLTHKSDTA